MAGRMKGHFGLRNIQNNQWKKNRELNCADHRGIRKREYLD